MRGNAGGTAGVDSAARELAGATNLGAVFVATTAVLGGGATRGGAGRSADTDRATG